MLNKNVQPSTIGGIKRRAKQIKKANNVPHLKALDIAARSAHLKISRTREISFKIQTRSNQATNYFLQPIGTIKKTIKLAEKCLKLGFQRPC